MTSVFYSDILGHVIMMLPSLEFIGTQLLGGANSK